MEGDTATVADAPVVVNVPIDLLQSVHYCGALLPGPSILQLDQPTVTLFDPRSGQVAARLGDPRLGQDP